MKPARLFLSILLCALAVPAQAQDPFMRIGQAVRMTNYSGVMVYHQGDRMETLSIVHRYSNGMERERLRSLTGDPVEFLRDGATITCIVPRDREVMVDLRNYSGLFPALPERAPEAFRSGLYKSTETDGREMLGRSCRRVHIEPMDEYRYGYRLWVDKRTGLPLKYQLLNRDGKALEQAMFTEISFPESIADEKLAATLSSEGFVRMKHEPMSEKPLENGQSRGQWNAEKLPAGFMLMQRQIKHMTESMGDVEHLVYSDGLASVSVYVATSDDRLKPFMGATEMGPTSVYGAMQGKHHIAVVGEVPFQTVELIGKGMRMIEVDPQ